MSETYDTPQEAIKAFKTDLPDLQTALTPLFSSTLTWDESREKLSTLDRAKMDILLAYAINDLVWVYLKLRGVDPEDHQVTKELERIKKYYAKIRQVEQPELQRSTKVDQDAAKRFITAAIPRSQRRNGDDDMPSTSAAALAKRQARDVDGDGKERAGKSGRFRFIANDVEKFVADQGDLSVMDGIEQLGMDEEDAAQEEEDDGEEEEEDDSETEAVGIDENMEEQADNLLRGLQGEIDLARGQGSSEGNEQRDVAKSSGINGHSKRKRAEDMA